MGTLGLCPKPQKGTEFPSLSTWLRGMPRSGSGKSKNLRFLAGLGAAPQTFPSPRYPFRTLRNSPRFVVRRASALPRLCKIKTMTSSTTTQTLTMSEWFWFCP